MGANRFINNIDPAFHDPNDPPAADYEEKLIDLIVSGDTDSVNWVEVTLRRCVTDCEVVLEVNYGPGTGPGGPCAYWSDPATWIDRTQPYRVPEAGDYVHIPPGECFIIDIGECEMPRLKFVEINGLLKSLDDGPPRALRAYNIWVRQGELQIG